VPVRLNAGGHTGVTVVQMTRMRPVLVPVTQSCSSAAYLGGCGNVCQAVRMDHGDIQQCGAGEGSLQCRPAPPDCQQLQRQRNGPWSNKKGRCEVNQSNKQASKQASKQKNTRSSGRGENAVICKHHHHPKMDKTCGGSEPSEPYMRCIYSA
jgi:hypothetical protein